MTGQMRSLAIGLALIACCGNAVAATVHVQPLERWTAGWCSPCGAGSLGFRVFASFTLAEAVTLNGGTFAILDHTLAGPDDISVSIWDLPFGRQLFGADFAESGYTQRGSASTYFADVALPDWSLAPGTYWISLYGTNGNFLSWGTDGSTGDDAQFFEGRLVSDRRFVGFSLRGEPVAPVPLPGSGVLFCAGLLAIAVLLRERGARGTAWHPRLAPA